MSCDGCNKLATNNMTLDKFLQQREKQVIDMDLVACLLILSMIAPMVFSKRLQFVSTTPMTFSRHNRKSNIFVLEARGPVGQNQDLEGLDYSQLLAFQKEQGKSMQDALADCTYKQYEALYTRCLVKGRKRTTTK